MNIEGNATPSDFSASLVPVLVHLSAERLLNARIHRAFVDGFFNAKVTY